MFIALDLVAAPGVLIELISLNIFIEIRQSAETEIICSQK